MNNTTGWGVDSIFTKIGVTSTRLDIGEGAGIGILKTAIADGMHPLPVYTQGSDGNLNGLTPAQCAADMKTLGPQLRAMGITELEFGNESYLTESAATYAAQYNAAHVAIAGMGVKLLAVSTNDQYGRGDWFTQLTAALPGGAAGIDAFTVHPYGPTTGTDGGGNGWSMVQSLHAESVAAGFSPSLPWYITEVGQQLDGPKAVSRATQTTDLTYYLNDLSHAPWVVFFCWYTSRDDGSGMFGLLNSDNSPRPVFTELQSWVQTHASSIDG